MATFIIADNRELTAYAIEMLIKDEGQVWHIIDKYELIERLKSLDGNVVVILDYTLFDFNDVESLLIIGERFPKVSWILFSDDLTEQFLKRVIYNSRNMSVVFKDSPLKEIIDALDYTVHSERYICQRVTEILLSERIHEEEVHASKLTHTEIEILKSIAQGKTTKEIASERFSSIHTINTHRKNIFHKLGVNTAHEAVKSAFRSGLIDTSEYYI